VLPWSPNFLVLALNYWCVQWAVACEYPHLSVQFLLSIGTWKMSSGEPSQYYVLVAKYCSSVTFCFGLLCTSDVDILCQFAIIPYALMLVVNSSNKWQQKQCFVAKTCTLGFPQLNLQPKKNSWWICTLVYLMTFWFCTFGCSYGCAENVTMKYCVIFILMHIDKNSVPVDLISARAEEFVEDFFRSATTSGRFCKDFCHEARNIRQYRQLNFFTINTTYIYKSK
jgi:hypothetical protein